MIFGYEDLEVWNKAVDFAEGVCSISLHCKGIFIRDYDFT